jgi:hypothetical protein
MDAIEQALYTTLSGGTALTTALGGTSIYYGLAPLDAALPYVVVNLQAGNEGNEVLRRNERRVYLVKALASSLGSAETLAGHIDDLLHGATLSITGYANYWSARESIVRYREIDPQAGAIGHAGGEYAFEIEKNT